MTDVEREKMSAYGECLGIFDNQSISDSTENCTFLNGSITQSAGPSIHFLGQGKMIVDKKTFEFKVPPTDKKSSHTKFQFKGQPPIKDRVIYVQESKGNLLPYTASSEACLLAKNPELKNLKTISVEAALVEPAAVLTALEARTRASIEDVHSQSTEVSLRLARACAVRQLEVIRSGRWPMYSGDKSKLDRLLLYHEFDETKPGQFDVGWTCTYNGLGPSSLENSDYEIESKAGFNFKEVSADQQAKIAELIRKKYKESVQRELNTVARCEKAAKFLGLSQFPRSSQLRGQFEELGPASAVK